MVGAMLILKRRAKIGNDPMLDIKLIRTQPDLIRKAIENRGGKFLPKFEELLLFQQPSRDARRSGTPARQTEPTR